MDCREGDKSRDSQFITSSFLQSSVATKSSRSRNFSMDRSFDKKKIVNLQIAAEVTKSSFLYLQSQIEKKIFVI